MSIRPSSFLKLVSRLKIAVLEIEDWVILQRSKFDIIVDGEPYPALQLYLNSRSGLYLTRVWGRTCSKGEINSNSYEDIGDLCNQVFGQGLACCPGKISNNVATKANMPASKGNIDNLILVEYPFQRKISLNCAVLHMPDEPLHEDHLVVCSECKTKDIFKCNDNEEVVESFPDKVRYEELSDHNMSFTKFDDNAFTNFERDKSYPSPDVNKEALLNQLNELSHGLSTDIKLELKSVCANNVNCKPQYDKDNIKTKAENAKESDGDSSSNDPENKTPVPKENKCDSEVNNDSGIGSKQPFGILEEDYEPPGVLDSTDFATKRRRGTRAKIVSNYSMQLRSDTKQKAKDQHKPRTRLRNPNRLVGRTLRLPKSWTGKRKEKFQCEHCEVSFHPRRTRYQRLPGLEISRHYRKKHLWGNFYCSLCNFFAYYPREYASHMLEIHSDMEGGDLALCTECNCQVSLKGKVDTLSDHYKECVESWDNVAKEYRNRIERRKRIERDVKQDNIPFICQLCGKEYRRVESFRGHMREHRLANHCSQTGCNIVFRTLEERNYHENNEHQIPCEKCGKVCKNKPQLRQHDRAVHIEKTPCDKCGKMFKCKRILKEHIEIQHEQKPRIGKKCTECDSVFPYRAKMVYHRNTIHFPNRHQCETCKKSFGNGCSLKKHTDLVHNDVRNFPCDECDKRFQKRGDLVDHKTAHHRGEKPFACQYCPYRGTSSSLLWHHKRQRHKVEHEEEKKDKDKVRMKAYDVLRIETSKRGLQIMKNKKLSLKIKS